MVLDNGFKMAEIEKSYAKVNIFLKVVGFKEGYHQIVSRFILLVSQTIL